MSQYEVKTPDGQIHRIEAVTHVLDSNGLTLYIANGVAAAIFPKFDWMRQVQAVVADTPDTTQPEADAGTSSPAVTGE